MFLLAQTGLEYQLRGSMFLKNVKYTLIPVVCGEPPGYMDTVHSLKKFSNSEDMLIIFDPFITAFSPTE